VKQKVFESVLCHLYRLACEAYLRCLQSEARKTEKVKRAQAELKACEKRLQNHEYELQKGCEKARLSLMMCKTMTQPDAVTAVILSVATLEGFINGLTEYSRWHNPDWEAWGNILYEAERQHASVRLKYLLAAYSTGQTFDRGAQPYQDFELLIGLRDALVHPKNLIGANVVKQVLMRVMGEAAFNSKYQHIPLGYGEICSTSVAKWACNTTSEMIHAVLDKLPAGRNKEAFEMMFCKWLDGQDCFQPVE